MHIYVSVNYAIIGLNNGLAPVRRQAIIWTNAGVLLIDPCEHNLVEFEWKYNNSLRWRHNGRDSVSNHQPHHCLLNRLYRRRSKKTSKLRVIGLCAAIHRGPVNSRTNGQKRGKCFHLMTSSCFILENELENAVCKMAVILTRS